MFNNFRLGNSLLKRILHIPKLYLDTAVLNIYNFKYYDNYSKNIELFRHMKNISYFKNLLLGKTNKLLILNFHFEKNNNLNNDILNISNFKNQNTIFYENLAWYMYQNSYTGINTNELFSKSLVITFPQIFNKLNPSLYTNVEVFEYDCNFEENNFDLTNLEDFNIKLQQFNNFSKHNNLNIFNSFLHKYNKVAVGGSFDHIHFGHYLLLTKAALISQKTLMIGITCDHLLNKKDSFTLIQPYKLREEKVKDFLINLGFDVDLQIFPLSNTSGRAGYDPYLEALVITEETIQGAQDINRIRSDKGLNPLDIIQARLIENETQNENELKISSRHIRMEIKNKFPFIDEVYLLWGKLMDVLNIDKNSDFCKYWFSIVRDQFSQPWRNASSNLEYLFLVISNFHNKSNNFFQEKNISEKNKICILLSLWFHKIVSIPSRQDNSEKSILLFKKFYSELKENKDTNLGPEKIEKIIIDLAYNENKILFNLDDNIELFLSSIFNKY